MLRSPFYKKESYNMKVTVYVNHEDEAVITEKEYFERLNKATEETAKDNFAFEEWVNDYYSAYDVWTATSEKQEEIRKKWKDYCRDYLENDGDMQWWIDYELEV